MDVVLSLELTLEVKKWRGEDSLLGKFPSKETGVLDCELRRKGGEVIYLGERRREQAVNWPSLRGRRTIGHIRQMEKSVGMGASAGH